MDITTIRLSKRLKERFRKLEAHPRETDEQLLKRLIEFKEGGSK